MPVGDDTNRWARIVRRPGRAVVLGWHEIQVTRAGADPAATQLAGIRLICAPGYDCPNGAIDITSTAVTAMLEGFLRSGLIVGRELSWRSVGVGARRRDTIEIGRR